MEEQEAQKGLFILERKLRTGQYEAQLEALQDFPSFIRAMGEGGDPLIKSNAYLRLADYFCSCGSNELRLAVLSSLTKCTEADPNRGHCVHTGEIVKRLGNLWRSNDIMAKAMVIKFYGGLSVGVRHIPDAIYRIAESMISMFADERESAIGVAHKILITESPLDEAEDLPEETVPLRSCFAHSALLTIGNLNTESQCFRMAVEILGYGAHDKDIDYSSLGRLKDLKGECVNSANCCYITDAIKRLESLLLIR